MPSGTLAKGLEYKAGLPRFDPRNYPALWTPAQSFVWDKAIFDVPIGTPEERVQFYASKWRNIYGKALEAEGYTVLLMHGPRVYEGALATAAVAPDRRRYVMWAKVRKRPIEVHVDVLDTVVPGLIEDGFELKE